MILLGTPAAFVPLPRNTFPSIVVCLMSSFDEFALPNVSFLALTEPLLIMDVETTPPSLDLDYESRLML